MKASRISFSHGFPVQLNVQKYEEPGRKAQAMSPELGRKGWGLGEGGPQEKRGPGPSYPVALSLGEQESLASPHTEATLAFRVCVLEGVQWPTAA